MLYNTELKCLLDKGDLNFDEVCPLRCALCTLWPMGSGKAKRCDPPGLKTDIDGYPEA